MPCVQLPMPALRPYVESVWLREGTHTAVATTREHALPTGRMHLAVRLDGTPLRLFEDDADATGRTVGEAVVAGARAGYYIKETAPNTRTIGVQLRPGAAQALFGVSAAELGGRHVPLDALWGADAGRLYARLAATRDAAWSLSILQAMLLSRLRPVRGLHPDVARALAMPDAGGGVGTQVTAGTTSHRHFIALFRDATGLSPKRYARVQRFRRLLAALEAGPQRPWIDLALAAGYSDQSHCIREFREFTGVSPRVYRNAAARHALHLPV